MSENTIADIHAAAGRPDDRPLYVYRVPPSLHGFGITEVGLVELTPDEEIMASKRAQTDPMRLAYELAKESLRQVNGKSIGQVDGSIDSTWARMHPKIRQLVISAYSQLHNPGGDDLQGFLSSRQVRVG